MFPNDVMVTITFNAIPFVFVPWMWFCVFDWCRCGKNWKLFNFWKWRGLLLSIYVRVAFLACSFCTVNIICCVTAAVSLVWSSWVKPCSSTSMYERTALTQVHPVTSTVTQLDQTCSAFTHKLPNSTMGFEPISLNSSSLGAQPSVL